MIFNPPNLADAKEVVFDTETDGLDWKRNKVVGFVLTWGPRPEETAYWPVAHTGGGNVENPEAVRTYLRTLAARPDLQWTGHHMKFDMHMAQNEGIHFAGRTNCTQVNAALFDEDQGSYSLDTCARVYGVTEKKGDELYKHLASLFGGEPDRKQMANFHKLRGDDALGVDYSCGDGQSTWEVWKHQEARLDYIENDDEVSLRFLWSLECRVLKVLQRMERKGVRIDEEKYEQVHHLINEQITHLREKEFFPGFKARSNNDVLKYLFDKGIKDGWKTTPTGKAQLNEEFLETNPFGMNVIKLRKLDNLMASFMEGQISAHIFNGRIHTTLNQTKMDEYGTITGRLSSSDPNLQQVPKRDKVLAPIFRSIFIPDDGYIWSANDYKQQEFVVFAHYSNSKMLIDGYNQNPPIDMHQRCADLLSVERDPTAKRLNLGKLYWMGVPKLAVKLGITVAEAQALSNEWDKQLPEASKFRYLAKGRAESRGYVRSFLGRRRRYKDRRLSYQAANAVIQMSSADITKLKMAEIDEYFTSQGESAQMLLQVHDELDWQFPKDRRDIDDKALAIMQDFSEGQPIHLRAKLGVDHSEGKNWGMATFGRDT